MDVQYLHAKRAELQAGIRTLKDERDTLAPAALNGKPEGPKARARIGQIDVARAGLASELETVEAALQSPEYQRAALAERLDATFGRNLARHQAGLIVSLRGQYDRLLKEDNLRNMPRPGSESAGKNEDYLWPEEIPAAFKAWPRAIAAQLTKETQTEDELKGAKVGAAWFAADDRFDNTDLIERLTVSLAIFKRHTQELLDSTELPPVPTELQAKLDELAPPPAEERGDPFAHLTPDQRSHVKQQGKG